MTPEEAKKLVDVLDKMSDLVIDLRRRVETLEKEVLDLQVKELSHEMKGSDHAIF